MKLIKLFAFLLVATSLGFGQASDTRYPRGNGYVPLTSTCSNANTTCDTAGVTNFGENGAVLGPQTLEFNTQGYGLAVVYVSGTSNASGSTIVFEFSDDGGSSWYSNVCTRTDTNIQLSSDSVPSSTYRAYDCGVGAATRMRVRQTAISSGTLFASATLTTGLVEPAPTIQLSSNGTSGANPCLNPHANLQTVVVAMSGTSLTQFVAASGTTKIYPCAVIVFNGGGTTPKLAIETGTGSNCGTGTAVFIDTFAVPLPSTNGVVAQAIGPVGVMPAGAAACYILTGTTPTGTLTFTFVQQ